MSGGIDWTKHEIALLREYRGKMPDKDVAVLLGRSLHSVRVKARRLGIKAYYVQEREWSSDDELMLAETYDLAPCSDLTLLFGRTTQSIRKKAKSMGIRKSDDVLGKWDEYDEEYLRNHYLEMSDEQIGEVLGHQKGGVIGKRKKLGSYKEKHWRYYLRKLCNTRITDKEYNQ